MSIQNAKKIIQRREVPLKRKGFALLITLLVHLLLFIFISPIKVEKPLPPIYQGPPIDIKYPGRPKPKPKPPVINLSKGIRKKSHGKRAIPNPVPIPEEISATEITSTIEKYGKSMKNTFATDFTRGKGVVIDPPVLLQKFIPDYPELDKKLGLEGEVKLIVDLNSDGEVEKVAVMNSSGSNRLDKAAINAAYRCIFSAASQNGKRIGVSVSLTYVFALEGTEVQ